MWATSPTSGPGRAGCTWPRSSTWRREGGGLGHGRAHAGRAGLRRPAYGHRRPPAGSRNDLSFRPGDPIHQHRIHRPAGRQQDGPVPVRPRQCWDNAVAESFFASLKLELVTASRGPRSPGRRTSSGTSRCSSTAIGCTPRSATSRPTSTRPPPSTTTRPLRRHSQAVRQTGSTPTPLVPFVTVVPRKSSDVRSSVRTTPSPTLCAIPASLSGCTSNSRSYVRSAVNQELQRRASPDGRRLTEAPSRLGQSRSSRGAVPALAGTSEGEARQARSAFRLRDLPVTVPAAGPPGHRSSCGTPVVVRLAGRTDRGVSTLSGRSAAHDASRTTA